MASIVLRNVTKVFDRCITAVRDLSLDVRDGELMVLVGPSGCGKTTTLSLIAGLEGPTSGEIRIADRIVNQLPARQRDVAMVFQDGALYPHMSVYENLAFALRMRGMQAAEIQRRVQMAGQVLGITDLMSRRPASLSGGQRQRVALGRAIVREPTAFLLDEPLTGLDAGLRLAMRREIKSLHQKLRITTLYVTHDQSEAMALADRMCVLRAGRVEQVGPPDEVYTRPASRFVGGFFGTPPMNFLTGSLHWKEETPIVDLHGQMIRLSSHLHAFLREYGEQTIVVGVRPHDLSFASHAGATSDSIGGRVVLVEPLGSQTNVHVNLTCGQSCTVVTTPQTSVRTGDEVQVHVDPDRWQLFEDNEAGTSLKCRATVR